MTPAVNWGAAEVNCHTGGARTSLHLPLPVPSSPQSGAAQQSPSVAMATSISLLPISSKALARLLRSPSSCCRASQRSRITPVGLALVAK